MSTGVLRCAEREYDNYFARGYRFIDFIDSSTSVRGRVKTCQMRQLFLVWILVIVTVKDAFQEDDSKPDENKTKAEIGTYKMLVLDGFRFPPMSLFSELFFPVIPANETGSN
ncbi:hypothetical protein Y032_0245g3561 [Ancylostoma ceylanicum]|nr:hypothetical protein Y032_0245g3561 [Ancylostoma ceylanicum]